MTSGRQKRFHCISRPHILLKIFLAIINYFLLKSLHNCYTPFFSWTFTPPLTLHNQPQPQLHVWQKLQRLALFIFPPFGLREVTTCPFNLQEIKLHYLSMRGFDEDLYVAVSFSFTQIRLHHHYAVRYGFCTHSGCSENSNKHILAPSGDICW